MYVASGCVATVCANLHCTVFFVSTITSLQKKKKKKKKKRNKVIVLKVLPKPFFCCFNIDLESFLLFYGVASKQKTRTMSAFLGGEGGGLKFQKTRTFWGFFFLENFFLHWGCTRFCPKFIKTRPFRQIDPTTEPADSGNANAGVFGQNKKYKMPAFFCKMYTNGGPLNPCYHVLLQANTWTPLPYTDGF